MYVCIYIVNVSLYLYHVYVQCTILSIELHGLTPERNVYARLTRLSIPSPASRLSPAQASSLSVENREEIRTRTGCLAWGALEGAINESIDTTIVRV